MLVSSIKGQIWHLDVQQGALLLSEDGSHLILALSLLLTSLTLPNKVSLEKALALRICL